MFAESFLSFFKFFLSAACSYIAAHRIIFSVILLVCCSSGLSLFCFDLFLILLLTAVFYGIITHWAKVTSELTLCNTHSWSLQGPRLNLYTFWMFVDLSCSLSHSVCDWHQWFNPMLKTVRVAQWPSVGRFVLKLWRTCWSHFQLPIQTQLIPN